jgi:intraflagellar transport protein 122
VETTQNRKTLFSDAYELASLGVTEKDWKVLGLDALENMEFQVAKKAFHRIKDCRSLLLINEVEVSINS